MAGGYGYGVTQRRIRAPRLSFNVVRRLVVLGCLLGACLAGEQAADARDAGVGAAGGVPSSAMAWHVPDEALGARLPQAAGVPSDRDCGAHAAAPPKSRSVSGASRPERSGAGTLANTGSGRSVATLLTACALLGSGLVFRRAARRRKDGVVED
ncbi:hypothetical protein GCM10009839_32060 [Catenulispora yoronensis]|uniref:LPXTG cell wall anchor domain-containing protein n=1 Tax=Catenulispora yoronensis TaxID=450799 RepID=A0ABN2U5M0_9ACTN